MNNLIHLPFPPPPRRGKGRLFKAARVGRGIDRYADLLKQFSRIFLELLDSVNQVHIFLWITCPMLLVRPCETLDRVLSPGRELKSASLGVLE